MTTILLNILWPTFALVALVMIVWFTLVVQRLGYMKRTPPAPGTMTDAAATETYFAPVATPNNNLANLFEMPVLFFALVPLLVIGGMASVAQVALAWLFVFARATHSLIHLSRKPVTARFMAYLASNIVLFAMWIGFFVDMVVSANAYSQLVHGVVR
jgi:hypothetical protein